MGDDPRFASQALRVKHVVEVDGLVEGWTEKHTKHEAMEALAAGVPLVVSDLPVFHEIFGKAATYATGPIALATALRSATAVRLK